MGSVRRWTTRLAIAFLAGGILVAATRGELALAFAGRPIAQPRQADPLRARPDALAERAPGNSPEVDPSPPAAPEPEIPEPLEPAPVAVGTPDFDCTPVAADGYRRGRRTPITLVTIDGAPIERATANAYLAMREAAAAEGHALTIFSAYRTHEEQQYFYDCYRSCACNNCSPAAKPGYSNHQMGRAVDIAMWPEVHAWLELNARRFGFVATVAGEPWHWELRRGAKPPKRPACPDE